MESRISPPVRSYLPAAILLLLLGWGGLIYVIFFSSPSGGTRWAFFFTTMIALTGTALPVAAFLNRRFPSAPPATPVSVVRQAMWFGIFGATLAWLQLGRVLTPVMALLLAIGLVLIEWLLRMRERSQWKPN